MNRARAAILLCLAWATTARADVSWSHWTWAGPPLRVGVHLAGVQPAENAGRLEPADVRFEGGLALGIDVRPGLTIMLDLDWTTATFDTISGHVPPPLPNGGHWAGDMNFTAMPTLLSARAWHRWHSIEPWFQVGGGLQSSSLELDGHWDEPIIIWPLIAFTIGHDEKRSSSDTSPIVRAGAGLDILSKESPATFGLGIERSFSHAHFGALTGGDTVDLGGWSASCTIGYRFGHTKTGS